jgi:NADH dehydrogenase
MKSMRGANATASKRRPRVVIVGANFAGIAAAQHLDGRYAVAVIDRSPWFEWLPNIHELLSGVKRPADLRLPRARLVTRAGHRFVRAEVVRIDSAAGAVITSTRRRFPFDACIVAVGGVLRRHRGARGDPASLWRPQGDHREPGGGGVAADAELSRNHRPRCATTLREVRGPFPTGSRVTKVTPTRVHVTGGKPLRSDLTIWTGGVKAPPLLRKSGLADRDGQWAPVTQALRSKRHSNVFIIGDAAGLPQPLGKQAYYALQMGMCAAGNV